MSYHLECDYLEAIYPSKLGRVLNWEAESQKQGGHCREKVLDSTAGSIRYRLHIL